ncbi:unnamed protein product, partial [Vitis vinifera]
MIKIFYNVNLNYFEENLINYSRSTGAMGRKKTEDSGATTKVKPSNKDASKDGKKEKLSVSAMLASMDQKSDKPKKGSSSSSTTTSKPKAKAAPKLPSYTADIDLPPSDDEDDAYSSEEDARLKRQQRAELKTLDISVTEKELKKREKKDMLAVHASQQARQEALKDDHDAFTVVIGSRASVLDGEDEADANVKDVTIENFSVSARGKELLKNASVKISHGKRYGLVGPNGMGKSTLLKLLAWRKIPVPKNIDVLLVEQEVIGDDNTALQAVISANEELVRLRQEDENDAQASKILAGLGFTKDMQGRATRSFSGGWRMRISLARALFVQPTLLLLDEPTNHLDLRAVLWLEEYLCRWKKTLVVVSHDRDFLNTVCSEIIHLHDQKLHFYRGNFDDFESGYEQRRKEMNKKDYSVEFHFPEPTELSDVDVGIDMGTRVAIVGPNGAGKSTLLNLLAGDLVPTEGEVRRIQYLLRLHPDQEGLSKQEAVRAKLGKFGLPSHNHLTPIMKLSGGQKARVVFTSISMSKPHILLLDEPTNHLDMQSIDALADALDEFSGGVVLVSHDSRLISRVCENEERSEIWVVENGTVSSFPGSFEEYKEELQREIKAEKKQLGPLLNYS